MSCLLCVCVCVLLCVCVCVPVCVCRAVGDVLTNLKGIATEMGSELDRQNDQLDRLNKKAAVNTTHLDQANSRIRRQL